jgi:uncharacterized membrane protein ArfC
MNTVNWWLMALAFVLGLLLTFVTIIRRVKREVPIQQAATLVGASGGPATARFASDRADAVAQAVETSAADSDSPSKPAYTGTAAGTAAAGAGGAARLDGGESATQPHAPGSVSAIPGGSAPAGYPINANEDTMAETPAAEDDSTTKSASPGTSEDKPYGAGSVRVAAGTKAPQGYTIKGNENSMLYHTPDSPSYAQTIAEVWFTDEESAVRAGFTPWHKGRKAR